MAYADCLFSHDAPHFFVSEAIQYRPATNGYPLPSDDGKLVTVYVLCLIPEGESGGKTAGYMPPKRENLDFIRITAL